MDYIKSYFFSPNYSIFQLFQSEKKSKFPLENIYEILRSSKEELVDDELVRKYEKLSDEDLSQKFLEVFGSAVEYKKELNLNIEEAFVILDENSKKIALIEEVDFESAARKKIEEVFGDFLFDITFSEEDFKESQDVELVRRMMWLKDESLMQNFFIKFKKIFQNPTFFENTGKIIEASDPKILKGLPNTGLANNVKFANFQTRDYEIFATQGDQELFKVCQQVFDNFKIRDEDFSDFNKKATEFQDPLNFSINVVITGIIAYAAVNYIKRVHLSN